jgi:hypothetical protein
MADYLQFMHRRQGPDGRDYWRGKYQKVDEFREQFDIARECLKTWGGELRWGEHDYEAMVYEGDLVKLIFYPHKTSAGHYHLRVRDSGSRNKQRADEIMESLNRAAGMNCIFSRKIR